MTRLFLLLSALMLAVSPVHAEFNGHRFLKISSAEQAAVVKGPDGELRLVRPGDKVGDEAILVEIDFDRAVLEKDGEWGTVTLIVNVENGEQRIARMERRPLEGMHFYRGEVKVPNTQSQ